jgi:sec-independent protein translocase protein TatA
MFGLGTTELIVILVVMLLLFGSRLPNIMRSLGKSVTEFKKGMNEMTDEQPANTYHQAPPQNQQPVQQNQQQPPQTGTTAK